MKRGYIPPLSRNGAPGRRDGNRFTLRPQTPVLEIWADTPHHTLRGERKCEIVHDRRDSAQGTVPYSIDDETLYVQGITPQMFTGYHAVEDPTLLVHAFCFLGKNMNVPGCTIAAAERICADEAQEMTLILTLNRSLSGDDYCVIKEAANRAVSASLGTSYIERFRSIDHRFGGTASGLVVCAPRSQEEVCDLSLLRKSCEDATRYAFADALVRYFARIS